MTDRSPGELFEILSCILDNVKIKEIEISPFIIPLEQEQVEETQDHLDSIASASSGSISDARDLLRPIAIHPFTLFEGDKLVIPQKPLYKVFAYAVKALSTFPRSILLSLQSPSATRGDDSHTSCCSEDQQSSTGEYTTGMHDTASRMNSITRAILLQNPEHGRALNLRKKLLLIKLEKLSKDQEQDQALSKLEEELKLTKLTLCIAANAKMAPLWHHRKWLYFNKDRLALQGAGAGTGAATVVLSLQRRLHCIPPVRLSHQNLQTELDLVALCAERYPRNYQAWAFRTWLMKGQLVDEKIRLKTTSSSSNAGSWSLLKQQQDTLLKHLSTHIGDHTAASHLIWLHRQVSRFHKGENGTLETEKLATFALDFVKRYPDKETPWLLLRGVILLRHADDAGTSEFAKLVEAGEALTKGMEVRSNDQGSAEQKEGQHWRHATRMLFFLSCYDLKGRSSQLTIGPDFSRLSSSEGREVLEDARVG